MVEIIEHIFNFVILCLLEVVLGIDNLIFLAILTERFPKKSRKVIRRWGLSGALILRLVLLSSALYITQLSEPLFVIFNYPLSASGIFFICGGFFLIYKSLQEIAGELEFLERKPNDLNPIHVNKISKKMMVYSIFQIMIMDLIFSLDSVLTAVGLSNHFYVMACAIVFAILIMLFASELISDFIHQHPSIKMMALAFLVMLGTFLIGDGFEFHISRGYLYFSMFFSFSVEGLNIIYRRRRSGRG
ncbi:MAG: TerC family protein [Gammaproteobacteria bacterium]|nr:TerC family protein [Gammaproteobacteria bacterium]